EYAARRYAASIPPGRQALQMNPRMSRVRAAIGDAMVMLGRFAEARTEYQAEPAHGFGLAGLAVVEHKLGQSGAAHKAYDEMLQTEGERMLYQQAQVLAQWGQTDAAMKCLQRALVHGDSGLVYARNDPFLDPLRGDPRLAQLLSSMGFA
ncbi:MAG: hypothetical protein OEX15_03410, partial [Gammaproteobacteria bacterium]|nr:hypothetical protein [Gammaproteobacteria bacterium]